MALNEETVAGRAKMLLSSRGEDVSGLHLYRLIAIIPNARRALALQVNREGREGLRKDFTLTISGGSVDLTGATHLGASEPLLLDTVRRAEIRSAGSAFRWQWVGNRSLLALQPSPASSGFINYTVEGPTLYTNAPDASAIMRAGYEPSLTTIETQGLDGELVEMVALMAMGGKEEQAA